MVVLDTSVIIDYLRIHKKGDSYLVKLMNHYDFSVLSISLMTIQELYIGQSSAISEREKEMLELIKPFQVLDYTIEVAKLAGEIERDRNLKIGIADCAIAATAIINESKLATLNIKDFTGIKGLLLVE